MKVVRKADTEVFSYMQKDHRIRKLFLKLLGSLVFLLITIFLTLYDELATPTLLRKCFLHSNMLDTCILKVVTKRFEAQCSIESFRGYLCA